MSTTNQKVEVCLDQETREFLEALAKHGSMAVRQVRNARVLLLADEDRRLGRRPDWYIAERVGLSEKQITRIRQRFVREGLPTTLERQRRSDAGVSKKIAGAAEARLIALCCSEPPEGYQRWTVRLLTDEFLRLQVVAEVCPETVRRCLKKTGFNLGGPSDSASSKKTAPVS